MNKDVLTTLANESEQVGKINKVIENVISPVLNIKKTKEDKLNDLYKDYDSLEKGILNDDIKKFKPIHDAYQSIFKPYLGNLDISFHYQESSGISSLFFTTATMEVDTKHSDHLEQETKIALNTRKFSHQVKEKVDEFRRHSYNEEGKVGDKVRMKTAELLLKIAERVDSVEPWLSKPEIKKDFLQTNYLAFLAKIANEAICCPTAPQKMIGPVKKVMGLESDAENALKIKDLIKAIELITRYQLKNIKNDNKDLNRWLESCYENLNNITNQAYNLIHGYGQLGLVPLDLRTSLEVLSHKCKDAYLKNNIKVPKFRKKEINEELKKIKSTPPEKIPIHQLYFLDDFLFFDNETENYTPEQYLRELIIRRESFVKEFVYQDTISDEVLNLYREKDNPLIQEELLILFKRHVLNLDYYYEISQNCETNDTQINAGIYKASSGQWHIQSHVIEWKLPPKGIDEVTAIVRVTVPTLPVSQNV